MGSEWRGRAVSFASFPGQSHWPARLELTEDAARKLALSLAKLKQTTLIVPVEVVEILDALNYVLVGDPASVKAHRQMEAGKGMEPSGG